MPPSRTWTWFLAVLLINFLVVRYLLPRADAPVKVPYTLFKQEVTKRNVRDIYSRGESLEGRFIAPVTYPPPGDSTTGTNTRSRSVRALRRGASRSSRPRCPRSSTRASRRSSLITA